jgi:hypothetical protein
MFTKETVFILGAGASVPYGYPTGKELLKQLRDVGEKKYSPNHTILIKDTDHFRGFYQSNFESSVSIDSFLRDNPKLFEPCIRLICTHLLTLEQENIFTASRDNGRDWLQFVVEEVCRENKPETILDNKVKFITFNYDKSLEKYLYQSLKDKEIFSQYAEDFIKSENRIIHVYGDLYKFDFEKSKDSDFSQDVTEYGKSGSITDAFYAYDQIYDKTSLPNIKLIGGEKQSDNAEKAKKVLAAAKRVIVIGYGFDSINNEMIGLKENVFGIDKSLSDDEYFSYTNYDKENEKITKCVNNIARPLVMYGSYVTFKTKGYNCDGYDLLEKKILF